jgi:hypothetical protein
MFLAVVTVALACAFSFEAATAERASAINLGPVCGVAGIFSGLAGKACGVVQNGGRLFGAGKKLLGGHVGGAAKTLLGAAGSHAGAAVGLAAVGVWVLGGAKAAMEGAAKLINHTTSPQLGSSWFSASYWRMAGIAFVLTLPFLFAAAVQALLRSDLAMLARAAFGYLPLAVLAVFLAAPLTMLLLSASDEMSSIISSAAGGDGVKALVVSGFKIGALSVLDGSPFLAFLVGLFVAAGAFVLWLELLMREAAVYVVVMMLPLAFAAMVWPARRIWAVRAVELLVALILSKFAIVAVLSLAAAALGHGAFSGGSAMLSGLVLVLLAAFAPWALMRMLPLADIAGSAVGSLKREMTPSQPLRDFAVGGAHRASAASEPGQPESSPWDDEWRAGHPGEEGARAHTEGFATMARVPAGVGGGSDDEDFGGDGTPPLPSGPGGLGGAGEGSSNGAGEGSANGAGEDSSNGAGRVASNGAGPLADPSDPDEGVPGERFLSADVEAGRPGKQRTWRPVSLDPAGRPPPLDTETPTDETPAETVTADDPDPLPPDQEPEDGRL